MAKEAKHKMAKHNTVSEESASAHDHQSTEAPAPAAPATSAAVSDDRYRKLTLDDAGSTFAYGDTSKSGVTVNRIDFIRQSWVGARQSRGAIAKELTRLSGKKVTYQIVFSATKGTAGGPVAQPAAPSTPAA